MTEPIDQIMAGCTVLVAADRRSAELGAALQRRGATIRCAPALSMVPDEDDAQLIAGTRALIADPPGAIQAAGLQADWVAESETSGEIAEVLLDEGVAGMTIAVQHHGAGSDGLDETFTTAGARVYSLVVYRWGPPPDQQAPDESVRADAAGVTEPLLVQIRGGAMVAAAVGPITPRPLLDRNVVPIVPDRGRLGSLVRTIVAHYGGLQTLETVAGHLQVHRRAAVLDARVLPLLPPGIEVLRLLVRARGDVVLRSAVLTSLPGSSLDPHAAEVAIARLRDAAGSRALIRTVVKRGYRIALAERPAAGVR